MPTYVQFLNTIGRIHPMRRKDFTHRRAGFAGTLRLPQGPGRCEYCLLKIEVG
jgi:hypothetical protein